MRAMRSLLARPAPRLAIARRHASSSARRRIAAASTAMAVTSVAGNNGRRAGLVAALDYLRPGDTPCAWHLDRLGRSVKESVTGSNLSSSTPAHRGSWKSRRHRITTCSAPWSRNRRSCPSSRRGSLAAPRRRRSRAEDDGDAEICGRPRGLLQTGRSPFSPCTVDDPCVGRDEAFQSGSRPGAVITVQPARARSGTV